MGLQSTAVCDVYVSESAKTGNKFNHELIDWLMRNVDNFSTSKVFVKLHCVDPNEDKDGNMAYLQSLNVASMPAMEVHDYSSFSTPRFSTGCLNIKTTLADLCRRWERVYVSEEPEFDDDIVKDFLMDTIHADDEEDIDEVHRIEQAKRKAAGLSNRFNKKATDAYQATAPPSRPSPGQFTGVSDASGYGSTSKEMYGGRGSGQMDGDGEHYNTSGIPKMHEMHQHDDALRKFWENQEETPM
jgi:hypothetical protein